jgi:hypothetical protein
MIPNPIWSMGVSATLRSQHGYRHRKWPPTREKRRPGLWPRPSGREETPQVGCHRMSPATQG